MNIRQRAAMKNSIWINMDKMQYTVWSLIRLIFLYILRINRKFKSSNTEIINTPTHQSVCTFRKQTARTIDE